MTDWDEWAKVVFPARILASYGGLDLVRRCACQYGASGHCAAGKHGRCGHTTQPDWYDQPQPETHLLSSSGGALADVWTRTGCRWRCPCDCGHRKPVEVIQPTLF